MKAGVRAGVRSRTLLVGGLWVIAVLAALMGLLTFARPAAGGEVAKDAFGVLLVSFATACAFAARQARLIRKATLRVWLAATEVGRELVWGALLLVGLIILSGAVPDEDVKSIVRELANAALSALGIGSWMLLVGKFVPAQAEALREVDRRKPAWARRATSDAGGTVTAGVLLVLAALSIVMATVYLVEPRIETLTYFVTISRSVFTAGLMIAMAVFGIGLALVLIRFRRPGIPPASPLRSLPRQLIVVQGTIIAAFVVVIFVVPTDADVLSLFISFAGSILASVLLVAIPGDYASAFYLRNAEHRRLRPTKANVGSVPSGSEAVEHDQ